MAYPKDESNPFSDWSNHINKPVYFIDGKRGGKLVGMLADKDRTAESKSIGYRFHHK
jgi:hypothetical protein